MAYKQGNPLVKLIVLAVVVYGGYKYGLPWAKDKNLIPSGGSAASRGAGDRGCLALAEEAGAIWADGIPRYINPPVDRAAWDGFRSEVESSISKARSGCDCAEESCRKAGEAMDQLSALVRDMDSAVASGGAPPSDVVRSQERVDNLLDQARRLTNEGK
jgi:hypothetical protein